MCSFYPPPGAGSYCCQAFVTAPSIGPNLRQIQTGTQVVRRQPQDRGETGERSVRDRGRIGEGSGGPIAVIGSIRARSRVVMNRELTGLGRQSQGILARDSQAV